MTASHTTHSGSDNSGPIGHESPDVSTTDAQRVIETLEQNNGSLWKQTLVHRAQLTHEHLADVLTDLADAGVVTIRRGRADDQVLINSLRVADLRAAGRLTDGE
jgi:DNA-binding IscR family transcriptional regulator